MALPKLSVPTYELTIPSTGAKVSYRPFLVKEEKLLLMASEGDDEKAMTKALLQIITNCIDDEIDIEDETIDKPDLSEKISPIKSNISN